MADFWKGLSDNVKELGRNWTAYTAVGSFALYLLGYISLRFHLTALGIGTDLAVLDERYLFAGAKFLVYVVSSVPIVILVVLVLAAFVYLPYRAFPLKIRARIKGFVIRFLERTIGWKTTTNRLTMTGIIFSVLMIQLVMRKCFFFGNLLLMDQIPETGWLAYILLDKNPGITSLYFAGIVGGTALSASPFFMVNSKDLPTALSRFLRLVLIFLVSVQFLLIPINYGILIADKYMPQVASYGDQHDLVKGQEAWLVWEGKEGVTYLVRDQENNKRTLITCEKSVIKETKIIRYDQIFKVIFTDQGKQLQSSQVGK